jgi:hypothetical protein
MDKVELTETITATSDSSEKRDSKSIFVTVEKKSSEINISSTPSFNDDSKTNATLSKSLSAARDFVTEILSVEDDPTQSPWTFRMWFIGIGVSLFAGLVDNLSLRGIGYTNFNIPKGHYNHQFLQTPIYSYSVGVPGCLDLCNREDDGDSLAEQGKDRKAPQSRSCKPFSTHSVIADLISLRQL